MARKPLTDKQRAALKKGQIKPGETRNRKGTNGWTRMRQVAQTKVGKASPQIIDKAIQLALAGDVQAMKLVLGPAFNVLQQELAGKDGQPLDFAKLAAKAREG